MKDWELEDWITEEGNRIVRKVASVVNGANALNPHERLIYEVWLFDTEQRNGGVSQYFCNYGLAQWNALSQLALPVLDSFAIFADAVNKVVGRSSDPYKTIIGSDTDLNVRYEACRIQLLEDLRDCK